MTAKEFLQQARGMRTRMEALRDRRRQYEDLAQSCVARYRPGPGGSTRRVSSVEEYATKLADLSREMQLRADLYADTLRQIERAIDAVYPPIYRDVLKLYYLNGYSWSEVASQLYYSRQGVWNVHNRALLAVTVPRDAEPVEDVIRRRLKRRG